MDGEGENGLNSLVCSLAVCFQVNHSNRLNFLLKL